MPTIGYTFVLAGFLKIMTVVGLANSAPQDTIRTALGEGGEKALIKAGSDAAGEQFPPTLLIHKCILLPPQMKRGNNSPYPPDP